MARHAIIEKWQEKEQIMATERNKRKNRMKKKKEKKEQQNKKVAHTVPRLDLV
jgi:hypothetical protein